MKQFVEDFFDFDPKYKTKRTAKMKSMFQDEEMADTDSSIDATSKQNNSVNADSVR